MIPKFISAREKEEDLISAERKSDLRSLANQIQAQIAESNTCNLTFICTHNSRRSQLAELLCRVTADHYDIAGIQTFSGGTEATAFNHRMVKALEDTGFRFSKSGSAKNPTYQLVSKDNQLSQSMFSKKYDHAFNPSRDYLAIMVCDHADQNCPIVYGATARIPLRYKDPKEFDDTDEEAVAYTDKVKEIGREMVYMIRNIKV